MDDNFHHDDASEPTMQEIPGIKRYVEGLDQGIISTGNDDEGHEINDGHGTRSVSNLS